MQPGTEQPASTSSRSSRRSSSRDPDPDMKILRQWLDGSCDVEALRQWLCQLYPPCMADAIDEALDWQASLTGLAAIEQEVDSLVARLDEEGDGGDGGER